MTRSHLVACFAQGASSAGAPGSGAAGAETTYIAWNRKVQHILASCSTNGTTVVWDLKRQKPVMTLRDPSRYGPA
jgi:protein transport protein SEC31